ncbi:MAG: hypothetical protein AAF649_06085 [Verrucomicrobiota bacterium]
MSAQTDEDDRQYHKIISSILDKVSSENVSDKRLDEAWSLLFRASKYPIDNNLSADLADAIYSVWLAQREQNRLEQANRSLRTELDSMRWNMQAEVDDSSLSGNVGSGGADAKEQQNNRQLKREIRLRPYMNRIEEIEKSMVENKASSSLSKLESKVQMQTLIVQLFLQRRFEHVLIGCRFYRSLFGDGDEKVTVADGAKELFSGDSGVSPTIAVISALSNEMIGKVTGGVDAYLFLMQKKELHSATERLAESFAIGEHLPVIKNLSREQKRLGLQYIRKSNELLTSLEVKDYTKAEAMIEELEKFSEDFQSTRAVAQIETAQTVSRMHLAKAQAAAAAGNQEILETELRKATEIWPRNPELQEFSAQVFSEANEKHKILRDLEGLSRRNNYRQIYDESAKFIAAAAGIPETQEKLRQILDQMQQVEIAMARAQENAKLENYPGAWEELELIYTDFPHDPKMNEFRTQYTVRAADFVNSIMVARDKEAGGEPGTALAWYLKARGHYIGSRLAKQGIERIAGGFFQDDVQLEMKSESMLGKNSETPAESDEPVENF